MTKSLPISEMFASLQGEGMLTGVPSFFIRFSGCNLRCRWCDTPYASWDPESTNLHLKDVIKQIVASNLHHTVITGGEPMMFDQLEPLTQALKAIGQHITIETAGTIARNSTNLHCDLMSISPKLSNSTPLDDDPRDKNHAWQIRHEARRINIEALQQLLVEFPEHQLKLVVQDGRDICEIDLLLDDLQPLDSSRILLMPEGVTPPQPSEVRWIIDLCIQRDWRYCPRLHIALFGNARGT